MRLLKLASLILLATFAGLSQVTYDFTGANTTSIDGTGKWKVIEGMDVAGMSIGISSNQGYPYSPSGVGGYGGVYYDSALAVGSTGFQIRIVLKQLSGTNNVKNFYLGIGTGVTFATMNGYDLQIQQNTGADYMYGREFNQWTPIENGTSGYYPDGVSAPFSSDHAANDTFYVKVYTDGRKTFVRKRGTTQDSISTTDATYNVTTGAYAFIYGRYETTLFLVDDFQISTIGAAGSPPATEVNPPEAGTLIRSTTSLTKGSTAYVTLPWTDDSAGSQVVFDADTGGGYYTLSTHTISGTSGSQQSNGFTKYNAGTATLRGRVKDAANKWDTSATTTISFITAPTGSAYTKKVFGYLTFSDTRWTTSGVVPADSLPWDVLTHVSLFAAPGGNPIPSSYLNQLAPMTTKAHQHGVYAGLAYGGSSDAALISVINNPTAWSGWINYNLGLIDTYGLDFIDFDLEGTITVTAVYNFLDVFYDSLQVRQSANNSAVKPFIVLTVGPSRGASWVSLEPFVEILDMMSYDYIGDWWGRIIFDNQPMSYQFYNGTGTITDFYSSAGANAHAPSMQRWANAVINAGWPANKVLVGFDVNPTYWTGGTFPGGRGPTYIRQPTAGNTSVAGSSLDFASQWSQMSSWPTDSLHFDQTAKAYWIHRGTSLADDQLWVLTTYPGRDSAVWATRKIIDSMSLGGVMLWNLGSEIWNTPSVPTGGRGWFFHQVRTHFSGITDTIIAALNPPTTFSPADGATNQSQTPTLNWNDVSGVAGSLGYHLQVSASPSMSSPIKDTTCTPSQLTLASGYLSANTNYSYRVRVKNAANVWGGWSAVQTFTTAPAVPGAPELTSPANGATAQSQTVTLSWKAASGSPTHYHVLLDNNSDFSSPLVDDSTVTVLFRQVSGLANSTTYYWKVRAKSYPGGWGAYATSQNFTVGTGVPSPPALLSPINGADNQATDVILSWTRPAGADSFQLQIDSTTDFSTPFEDTLTALTTYTKTFTTGLTYYWRVYSNGTAGNSAYTGAFQFTVGTDFQPSAPGTPRRTPLVWDPLRRNGSGQYTSDPVVGIEMLDVPLSQLPAPYDSTTVVRGTRGYRRFNGDTVLYTTTAVTALTASALEESLKTRTLDSVTFDFATVAHLYRSTGGEYAVSGVNTNVSFNSVSVNQPVSLSDGGTASNLSGRGAPGYALFLEGPNDTVRVRAIDTSDITNYTAGGTNLGDATEDDVEASLAMRDSNKTRYYSPTDVYEGEIGADAAGFYMWSRNNSTSAQVGVLSGNDGSGLQVTGAGGSELIQQTSTDPNSRFRTTFTNSDGIEDRWMKKQTTTNNSATSAFYLSLDSNVVGTPDYSADGTTFIIYYDVIGNRTDASGYAVYSRKIVYDNNGGTVTERQEDVIGTDVESNANTACTFAVNGDATEVTVTGDTGQTWIWHVHARLYVVGN